MPLAQFLIELGKSPKTLKTFQANPERAMTTAGLTAAEKDAVLSGDPARIRRAIGAKADDDIIFVITVVITVVT
jgi:hypothetical protein